MNPATLQSAGLLVLRLVVGTTFLLHGLDKLGDLAGASLTITLAGPGRYSVDAVSGLSRQLNQRISRRPGAGASA
jgi:uncharacterized membrane protein YphA (DoxX/SURF4 family)